MPNSDILDKLVRISSPVIAPLAPSQDTTSDQLASFYRKNSIPFIRHSPFPPSSNAPGNAVSNTAAKETIIKVFGSNGSFSAGVLSLNSLTGALSIQSPNGTIAIGTAGASITEDIVLATSSQLGGIKLNTDLGNTATAPQVVATHLASPLPVNQGGSGSTSPSLVAGAGINITGSWPGQTIAAISGGVAIAAYTVVTESSDTGLSSGVLTSVKSSAITFPSSGGPFRVFAFYAQYLTTSGSSAVAEALVSDGTNVFAESEWCIPVNNGPSGTGSGMSPGTYANSANVTFTLKIQVDSTGVTARAAPFHAYGGRNSRLEIVVVASN